MILVPINYNLKFDELLHFKKNHTEMLEKLKKLVSKKMWREEESLIYKYKGKDKDLILSCMEFFYSNLYNKNFKDYIWYDDKDDWENYHIQVKYKDKISEILIVYGIGSFCVIRPMEKTTKNSKILDLEKLKINNFDIEYNE